MASRPGIREAVITPADRRSRISVGLLYFVMSVPIGGWAARVPDLRQRVGAGDALWGLANTIPSIGNVVGLCAIVLLVGRLRDDVLAIVGAGLVLLAVPLTAWSTSFAALVSGLTVWALVAHILDVPMGALALAVQGRYNRPLMGSFDACFGVGTLGGGALGTAAAALGVRPWQQFAVTSGLLGLGLAAMARWLPTDPARAPTGPARAPTAGSPVTLRRRFSATMLPIAAMAFLYAYVTEASILWSASYVTGTLGGGPVLGGIAYTAATAAGTAALLIVDPVTARAGTVRTVRVSTLVAALGFGVCLALGGPVAAIVGFVVLAIGMAAVNPAVYTFAGNQPGLSAGEGVSVVGVGQMPGAAIAAPALIGALSGAVGLRLALVTIVGALLALATLVGRVASHAGAAMAGRP